MTNREYHKAIVRANISDEITAYARSEIAKLDNRNEKRKNTPSKTTIANEPIKAAIIKYLNENEGLKLASVIGNALGITSAKASTLCQQLAEVGDIKVCKVKVPKVGIRCAYSAVEHEDAED